MMKVEYEAVHARAVWFGCVLFRLQATRKERAFQLFQMKFDRILSRSKVAKAIRVSSEKVALFQGLKVDIVTFDTQHRTSLQNKWQGAFRLEYGIPCKFLRMESGALLLRNWKGK